MYKKFYRRPLKELTRGKKSTGGRNSHGRITAYHRGGGHKRSYRSVDFHREKTSHQGSVVQFEYDPNRNLPLARIAWSTTPSSYSYILAPEDLKVNQSVHYDEIPEVLPGNALILKDILVGTSIHNINGQYCRSGGTSAVLVQHKEKTVLIQLPSGERKEVPSTWVATIGKLQSLPRNKEDIGKAGRNRWKGRRPHVRGVAMNPVDHPHGGGEGKTSGGRPSVTPWGKITRGQPTRNKKKPKLLKTKN